jgi:hypothetical protein
VQGLQGPIAAALDRRKALSRNTPGSRHGGEGRRRSGSRLYLDLAQPLPRLRHGDAPCEASGHTKGDRVVVAGIIRPRSGTATAAWLCPVPERSLTGGRRCGLTVASVDLDQCASAPLRPNTTHDTRPDPNLVAIDGGEVARTTVGSPSWRRPQSPCPLYALHHDRRRGQGAPSW